MINFKELKEGDLLKMKYWAKIALVFKKEKNYILTITIKPPYDDEEPKFSLGRFNKEDFFSDDCKIEF